MAINPIHFLEKKKKSSYFDDKAKTKRSIVLHKYYEVPLDPPLLYGSNFEVNDAPADFTRTI